jgi:hypothetical protein
VLGFAAREGRVLLVVAGSGLGSSTLSGLTLLDLGRTGEEGAVGARTGGVYFHVVSARRDEDNGVF